MDNLGALIKGAFNFEQTSAKDAILTIRREIDMANQSIHLHNLNKTGLLEIHRHFNYVFKSYGLYNMDFDIEIRECKLYFKPMDMVTAMVFHAINTTPCE